MNFQDFPGDSYREHTKCISEEEKYSAKGWQPKANANKGAKKQAAWLERLQALIDDRGNSLDADIKQVLSVIQGYENIPRKRQKFINFCKNVLSRKFSPSVIDKTWEVFETVLKEPAKDQAKAEEQNSNIPTQKDKKRKFSDKENGIDEGQNGVTIKEKKAKLDDDEDDKKGTSKKTKFDWIECISQVINKKGSIKWTRLKKKVVNEYITLHPETNKSRVDLETKLEKKVNKNKLFKVNNDVVSFAPPRD